LTALAIQGEDNLVSSLIKALTNSVFDTSIKAQIVKILKNLANDLQYGVQVQEMLDESPIWKQYKDQKMDLFLADKPRFAIEASPGQTNLYLTQGSSVPDAPPPVS
jgi:DnaJ family protein C protein 13